MRPWLKLSQRTHHRKQSQPRRAYSGTYPIPQRDLGRFFKHVVPAGHAVNMVVVDGGGGMALGTNETVDLLPTTIAFTV